MDGPRPRLLVVDPAAVDRDGGAAAIREAAAIIRRGGLVAFPTETVYGLGADALDADAVRRIFAAKGRPSFNPVIAHVADADAARALAAAWPDAAERLAQAFWPGPLTLVLPKRGHVPDALTAGLPAVALRVPAHPVALALVRAAGVPVAAPSANRYTELSPTTAAHVVRGLGAGTSGVPVDLVLDGGPTAVGIESTVVDLTGVARGDGPPRLLRPGTLDAARLGAVLGTPVAAADAPRGDAPRLAPGMVERHYAPRAAVWAFDADARAPAAARLAAWRAGRPAGRAGALLLAPWGETLGGVPDAVEVLPADPAGYARRLYAALHAMDEAECEVVLVERPPDGPEWAGVRDRLMRAAR
ncbi:threonylcarbamoyl-AMP synthase [Gemmatimonadetes bacterium T265]|nr:threonylcarbamoyl-AMP synthase [Gemmatimonadetes bacterium T265]